MEIKPRLFAVFLLSSSLCLFSCSNDDPAVTTYTITAAVFEKDSLGNYIDLNVDLTFYSNIECQTWTRTALADAHSNDSHLHYNAAANVSYDPNTVTFNWTEYGPEIDQASIDATCAAGVDGVVKSVNNTDYYQDKPNVYLKIINVVENS